MTQRDETDYRATWLSIAVVLFATACILYAAALHRVVGEVAGGLGVFFGLVSLWEAR